jgi:Cdc6-like AAA superfamily ATPase
MVVDEFDLLQEREARELTANLIKELHDQGSNVTVVLIGVAENVDELIINHRSLRRVLSFVKLERMGATDLNTILDDRFRLTSLILSDDARAEIVTLACGLPYYVQTLGKFAAQHAIQQQRLRVQIEDVSAAIENFLIESGESFAGDYQRATDSRQAGNIFQEVILASALAPSHASGVFKFEEVAKTLTLITSDKSQYHPRVQQYLAQFTSDRRGKILIRSGVKSDYRYRFSDALMQPFIIMRAMKTAMIDERLRRLLFHSSWPTRQS